MHSTATAKFSDGKLTGVCYENGSVAISNRETGKDHYMSDKKLPLQEVAATASDSAAGLVAVEAAGHSRREWMYLAERVFSHPRYALVIVIALSLCAFERYWFVIAPLTLFFTVELCLRLLLLKEKGWGDRKEMMFVGLDALATVALYLILFLPTLALVNTMYLRLARLLRGMYMLRMMRVLRFLTYESFVYSLPFAFLMIGLSAMALSLHNIALYITVALMIELISRVVAIIKVLPSGSRKRAEMFFAVFDFLVTLPLPGFIEAIPPWLVMLRLLRVLVMLNPLGSLLLAIRQVAKMPEVRKESGMLLAMLPILLLFSGALIYFVYPQMDLSSDGVVDGADYNLLQVAHFAFIWLIDPGTTPTHAYSPLLSLLTGIVAMTGVFFFALLVGLGSNVMGALLRELTNSPLSPRVQLLFSGENEKAESILQVFGEMCVRLRRSYFSAWVFYNPGDRVYSGFGSWLNIRQVNAGSRDVLGRFNLSGVREIIFFHRDYENPESIVDHHALLQEIAKCNMHVGVTLLSEAGLNQKLEHIYRNTMGVNVLNSSSVAARMLYQMHHCSYMPELGIEMLDTVEGEIGLFTASWQAEIKPAANGAEIVSGHSGAKLERWATAMFAAGVNVLAFRNEAGEFRLVSDMLKISKPFPIVDVVAIGRDPSLWHSMMERHLNNTFAPMRERVLKTFQWPEIWDLNLLFMGWHDGLPAMIEEMAVKHHKLTLNILNPTDSMQQRSLQQQRLELVCATVKAGGQCDLQVQMFEWDGLDVSDVMPLLRSCKVIMLYPVESSQDNEDSMLELWYHGLAGLLSARKQEVKEWMPPKVMILPRDRKNSTTFIQSTKSYPSLNIVVGSPDAFHDVYMGRHVLAFAKRSIDPKGFEQESKTFAFVHQLLGDAILVESEQTHRLLDAKDAKWDEVYLDGLRRGWVPLAYALELSHATHKDLYRFIDRVFPIEKHAAEQLHLLAGTLIDEFEMPASSSITLFCRRGVLLNSDIEKVVSVSEPRA
ncbi:MAG: hypothetical protein CO187_04285 [Zetaproteobacteria bacterium CG_4_9_14_3_um_filter_53_7]|nr:MAG: hypothetical protein CO187_04285 [Zetaproteobacteria bacterium CG_4_9_14_3_um_filter_53_7]